MTTKTGNKLPFAASEYITNKFRDEFLFEIKEVDSRGNYLVEVSKDGFIHTLCFDAKGKLLKEEADPAFPADAHEGPVPEDVPE
jgi:hypothetical protein